MSAAFVTYYTLFATALLILYLSKLYRYFGEKVDSKSSFRPFLHGYCFVAVLLAIALRWQLKDTPSAFARIEVFAYVELVPE